MASSGGRCSPRSASRAKSIIMMAFFFTMPISRMMPISAMTLEIEMKQLQGQNGAHAGRGQRGENRERMDVTFVEHAEDDVDGDDGGQQQPGFVGERVAEGRGGALKAGGNAGRHADVACLAFSMA